MPENPPSSNTSAEQTTALVTRANRQGLWLFAAYLAFYAGFVGLNAFAPAIMEMELIAGLNLAVVYGIALIVVAVVLAVFYAWLCRSTPERTDAEGER